MSPNTTSITAPTNHYPLNVFTITQQAYRNPTSKCSNHCIICKQMKSNTSAISSLKKTKHPIDFPEPDQHYNCLTKDVVYLITCNHKGCKAQYIGYTTRAIKCRFIEHLTDPNSPVFIHFMSTEHHKQIATLQILTKAPESPNKELWLKQQEYHWICKIGTLNKLSDRGLNKTIYDSNQRQ